MQQFILGSRLEAAVGVYAAKMVNGVIIAHLPVWDYDKYEGYHYVLRCNFIHMCRLSEALEISSY